MRASSVVVFALAVGCGTTPSSDGPDAGGGGAVDARIPDAPPGTHCTATTPRTATPTVFVTPTGFEQRMLDTIAGARHSLDIQMYLFSTSKLATAVIAAAQRGVAVRVLLDPGEPGNDSTRSRLIAASVPTKNDPAVFPYAHAKYLIVDGAAVTIMSANWNDGAMTEERNYGLVDTDADDVADVQTIFDADWAGTTPSLTCTRLLVSPIDAKQRVLDLVNGAQHTLDLEVLYVTDSTVEGAIVNAKNRGVAVRVILSDPATTPENTATRTFFTQKGVPVRVITTFDVHAKLIVADGATALIGSENLSYTSLSQNREVGALVFEPGTLAAVTAQVDADWATAN